MFRRRSLHGSSFAHPRAILFDPEARLVISFNGDAGQAGFTDLETMEFDDAGKSFEFREIAFPVDADRKAGVRISNPNPEPCLKCHGEPARPIWDTHPAWPGAYGERYAAALTPTERSGLREFLREQPTHPRYRYLLEVDRFANLETFRPSARTRYEGDERLPPNGELGAALGRLNFEAIVHLLESRPEFEATRYLLLATLGSDCGRVDAFFPDGQRAERNNPELKALADFRTFSERDPYCAYLARRSRAALATASPAAPIASGQALEAGAPAHGAARTQALLDQCAGCHLGGVGPQLPLDRPSELAALLRGGRFAHGTLMDEIRWRLAPQAGASRMPLGTNIGEEDRDALLRYF